MPQMTAQDSILLAKVQDAFTQDVLNYAPHTIGGLGTGLISLGLILWKTGVLKGIIESVKFNKQYKPDDPARPITKKDLEDALRPSATRIESISGEFVEFKKRLDDLTEELKELTNKQKDDKNELINRIIDRAHKLDMSFIELKTIMNMLLKG